MQLLVLRTTMSNDERNDHRMLSLIFTGVCGMTSGQNHRPGQHVMPKTERREWGIGIAEMIVP